MAARPVPAPNTVSSVLAGLFGKAVTVKPGKAVAVGPRDRALLGAYIADNGQLGAVITCDLAAAAALGAALALMHPNVAASSVKAGQLDENLLDNFQEVLNVMAGLVNAAGVPHLKLAKVHILPPPPPTLATLLTKPAARVDLAVTIAGYAPGATSILVDAA